MVRKTVARKKRSIEMRLLSLCRELDAEMDGVRVPASAAAILNGIRSVLSDAESADYTDATNKNRSKFREGDIRVGRGNKSERVFVGAGEGNYDMAIEPLSGNAIHLLTMTEEDVQWLIEALKKELGQEHSLPE
jgi:hypothetical protein